MQFKKTLFRIECVVTLLVILGKLGFLLAFRGADMFESTSVRTLWDLMVLTPALFFLCPSVLCQAITRSWSVKPSRGCMALEILCFVLFVLYYIILILSRTVASDALYRPLMLFLNNTWVFAILGGLHGLAPLLERRK